MEIETLWKQGDVIVRLTSDSAKRALYPAIVDEKDEEGNRHGSGSEHLEKDS